MTRIAESRAVRTVPVIADPPRWARLAAHAVALTVLPSTLWRVGVAAGFHLGYTEAGREALVGPTIWGPAYMVALSVLAEAAALLTLGLVHRWGVVAPRWLPFAGGRTVPRWCVLVPAWTGIALLAALLTPFALWWAVPHDDMTATGSLLVGFLYLPLVAWAPLLAAVTANYQRRRPRPSARTA